MTDLFLMPDTERLVASWLREQDALTALVEDRIYTAVPTSPDFPLLRLTRIGGIPAVKNLLWVDAPFIQFDCWGGPKSLAWQVAETTRALLDQLPGVHPEGVVTNTDFGELRYEPDPTYTPARPRYLFTATFTVHPTGDIGS